MPLSSIVQRSPPDHNLSPAISGAQFATLLHSEANRRGINGPVFAYGDQAVLFHPVEDPQQTTRLKRKTEEIRKQLSARLNNADVHCGVGRLPAAWTRCATPSAKPNRLCA